MRRIVILASSVWIAVFASVALFTLFWRVGYFRPHVIWGILSLLTPFLPMAWLAVAALWRCVRGPCRLRAAGWLLIGATPLIWCVSFLLQSYVDRNTHRPYLKDAPVQVAFNWASWILDAEARWRYPRWTYGRHVVLIDDGQTPSPEKRVSEMDKHIQAMAGLLGQPVSNVKLPWVRGPLGGGGGNVTLNLWAICGEIPNASELTVNDRHEAAHALISSRCRCVVFFFWSVPVAADLLSTVFVIGRIGDARTVRQLDSRGSYRSAQGIPCLVILEFRVFHVAMLSRKRDPPTRSGYGRTHPGPRP